MQEERLRAAEHEALIGLNGAKVLIEGAMGAVEKRARKVKAWGLIRSGLGMLRKGILRLEESADREQLRTLALRARHLRAYVGYEKAGQDAEGTWFLLDDINTIAYQVLQDTCGLCVKRGAEAKKCPLQKALRSCTTLHDDRQIDGCVFKPYTDSNYFGLLDEHSETVSD